MSTTTATAVSASVPRSTSGSTGAPRRLAERAGLVFVWVVLGGSLELGRIGFLALGIPLAVLLHLVVRRRPQGLWRRATASSSWWQRGVSALLVGVLAVAFVLPQISAEYADTIWTAGLFALLLSGGFLLLRRPFVAFIAAVALVALVVWTMAPRPDGNRTGDAALLARLSRIDGGYHDLSVAEIDLDAAQPVRFAGIGSGPTTRFEAGSVTKALTGLVIADAVDRGEVDLDVPVSTYLPALRGTRAGAATLRDLGTHHAGFPDDGAIDGWYWKLPLGRNPEGAGLHRTMQAIHDARVRDSGTFRYSNLGATTAGQATAAAAGMSYPQLMRTRLFDPLHLTGTSVQTTRQVAGGHSAAGRRMQPYVVDGLAPEGGVVTTVHDLARVATAVLNGSAPGVDALTTTATTSWPGSKIGIFWTTTVLDGRQIIGHSGKTSGYASFLGLDLRRRTAVVVLSDVALSVDAIGNQLLATERGSPAVP